MAGRASHATQTWVILTCVVRLGGLASAYLVPWGAGRCPAVLASKHGWTSQPCHTGYTKIWVALPACLAVLCLQHGWTSSRRAGTTLVFCTSGPCGTAGLPGSVCPRTTRAPPPSSRCAGGATICRPLRGLTSQPCHPSLCGTAGLPGSVCPRTTRSAPALIPARREGSNMDCGGKALKGRRSRRSGTLARSGIVEASEHARPEAKAEA